MTSYEEALQAYNNKEYVDAYKVLMENELDKESSKLLSKIFLKFIIRTGPNADENIGNAKAAFLMAVERMDSVEEVREWILEYYKEVQPAIVNLHRTVFLNATKDEDYDTFWNDFQTLAEPMTHLDFSWHFATNEDVFNDYSEEETEKFEEETKKLLESTKAEREKELCDMAFVCAQAIRGQIEDQFPDTVETADDFMDVDEVSRKQRLIFELVKKATLLYRFSRKLNNYEDPEFVERNIACMKLNLFALNGVLPCQCRRGMGLVSGLYSQSGRNNALNEIETCVENIRKSNPDFECPELPSREVVEDFGDEEVPEEPAYTAPVQYAQPSSGGCYVATAVYGSYDCPEVWTLRRFRDYTLAESVFGRLFIRTYYAISPTLVKWFGKTEWFRNLWKPTLDKMVAKLNAKGVENTPYEDKNW